MTQSNKESAIDLFALLQSEDVRNIVFSPGSRNAPLVVTASSLPGFDTPVVPDERAAGFFALGMAQSLGKAVAVSCTSGSAAANYYPAVTEAFYQRIPLILLTSDRPAHWTDQLEGQTIRQTGLFGRHVCAEANLLPDQGAVRGKEEGNIRWYNKRIMREAIQTALRESRPVHINLPFDEPLYDTVELKRDKNEIEHRVIYPQELLDVEDLSKYSDIWNSCGHKMVLVGQKTQDPETDALLEFMTNDPSVVVLTESTSNVKAEGVFPCIDRLIFPMDRKDLEAFRPDLLLTFGGAVISKKVKAFLREFPPAHHWHVSPHLPHPDTYKCLTASFNVSHKYFITAFAPSMKPKSSGYREMFGLLDEGRDKRHREFMTKAPYSDLWVFGELIGQIPRDHILQLANSSVVRYVQLFKRYRRYEHFANRGTSGIDGSVSTAAGYAYSSGKDVTLITGDISFFYDSNGLWHDNLSRNLKIILINNGGGGIFRIIDGPQEVKDFGKFFETRHNRRAKGVAENYGLAYSIAGDKEQLRRGLRDLYKNDGPAVLEVCTPAEMNDKILKDYFKFLKNG